MLAILILWNLLVPSLEVGVATGWLVYAVPLAVMFYHIKRIERKGFWSSVGIGGKNLAMGFVWVLGLMVVFSFIAEVYETAAAGVIGENIEEVTRKVEEYFAGLPDWYFWYLLPASFVPVALAEEMIFRGFVVERLLVKGAAFAIIVGSAMHASLHFWYGATGAGLLLFGNAFIISTWWGLAYYKTRNLIAPVMVHGLTDATLPIRRLWGIQTVTVINRMLALAGFGCLFYIMLTYLLKPKEKKIERAPPTPPPPGLERSIERMRSMLEELKKRRARRELSEEEYARLSERYGARIRELEEELTRRKAPQKP